MESGRAIREFLLALPGVVERETWGHPTFRVREKMFVTLAEDEQTATVKAAQEDQSALIAAEPAIYGVPAYVGRYGWVSVQLPLVDPGELRELLVEAWRRTAPKGIIAQYEATCSAVRSSGGHQER